MKATNRYSEEQANIGNHHYLLASQYIHTLKCTVHYFVADNLSTFNLLYI